MERGQERGRATRARIVAAATDLFAADGYEATSLDAVLASSGMSRGAFYHHFESKEALFAAVYEAIEIDMTARTMRPADARLEPREQLRLGCRRFLAAAGDLRFRRIAMIDAPAVLGWERWRAVERRHGLGILELGLRLAAGKSATKQELVAVHAQLLLATLLEAAFAIAYAPNPAVVRRTVSKAIDRLILALIESLTT